MKYVKILRKMQDIYEDKNHILKTQCTFRDGNTQYQKEYYP